MPAPLAKGLIIAASVIVAAGIAIYESPQVRQWVDQSRRKIAVALRDLSEDIHPRRPSESSDDFDARKKRREELVRRNRNELIRRAREEGVAVDLDELARIGSEDMDTARTRADRIKSFDDMVGSDGMLKTDATATGKDNSNSGLRNRSTAGFAAGSAVAATMVNPFSDDAVLFEQDGEDAPAPKAFTYIEPVTRESSATVEESTPAVPLIDLTPEAEPKDSDVHQSHLSASEPNQAEQSFYSFTSTNSHTQQETPIPAADPEADFASTGTLTPRSVHSEDPPIDDIDILSMQNSLHNSAADDVDTRSEVFSEGGFTDAGFSEAGFSEVDRAGVMTPASWTDVGSDDEEWGGAHGNGGLSQIH
ncbi:hypothetical protein ACN47E_008813 [Coniothyrium glycines]